MKTLFEQFKSGERVDGYFKYAYCNQVHLMYISGVEKTEKDKLLKFKVEDIVSESIFSYVSMESRSRIMSESLLETFQEISAEQFYEAYDLYVKYQSCVLALEEIFSK